MEVHLPDPSGRRKECRSWDHVSGRIALGGLLLVMLGMLSVAFASCADSQQELPVYWEAPEFALVDQMGDTLQVSDLQGTIWVASFVFTNCTSVCPLITQRLAELRDSLAAEGMLGEEVRLVSFTVDPERDTPAVLRQYAAKFGSSPPEEWAFLTGEPPETVRSVIQAGFKLTASAPPEHEHAEGTYQVAHSPRLVLVDRAGQVRGLYDSTEPASLDQLRIDLAALLK